VTFEHGGLFERSFETPAGWVDVLAEVVVAGRRLELRDMAVYPRSGAVGRLPHLVDEVGPRRVGRGSTGWVHRSPGDGDAPVGRQPGT
jgi:hypothetical protein